MGEVKFQLKPVEKKPTKKYRKRSKYDPIIDEFLGIDAKIVEVRDLKDKVKVSVINNVVYMEKLT